MPRSNLQSIRVDRVHQDPARMHRVKVTEASVRDLATSMQSIGQLSPIIVRPDDSGYALVAGHRRLLAAQRLGWSLIDARFVGTGAFSDWDVRTAENLERAQLSPYEEALAITDAVMNEQLEVADVALRMNRSTDWVTDRLELMDWPPPLQQAVHKGTLSLAAARPLAAIADQQDRDFLVDQAVKSGATARTTAAWLQECRARQAVRVAGDTPRPVEQLPETPMIFKQQCFACGNEFPAQELSRLAFCQACHGSLAEAIRHPPTPN